MSSNATNSPPKPTTAQSFSQNWPRGKLLVDVVAAKGLIAADRNGFSDPYALVSFGQSRSQTETKFKTLNPEWNQRFTFDVTHEDACNPHAALVVEVWDFDKYSADDFLGIVQIPLKLLLDVWKSSQAQSDSHSHVLHSPRDSPSSPVDSGMRRQRAGAVQQGKGGASDSGILDMWWQVGTRKEGKKKKKQDLVTGEVHLILQLVESSDDVTVDDFELLHTIGKGGFGKVLQVKKKDSGRVYAMKIMAKETIILRDKVEHTMAEKDVLQTLSEFPFIVGLKYSFQTDTKLYLIMDYINGGELFHHLRNERRFSEPKAKFYAAEILLAIEHLHSHGIIYRDLKPENCLLDANGHMVLTDFGLCKAGLGYGVRTKTFCGTPEYLAPEVLLGQSYTTSVDWWSFGTMLFEMVRGMPPFYDKNTQKMYEKVLNAQIIWPKRSTPEFRSLISALLDRDPTKRLGSGKAGAAEIKAHPFFAEMDWDKLALKDIKPPMVIPVSDLESVENIDREFLDEAPEDEHVESTEILEKSGHDLWRGFTFVSNDDVLAERVRRGTILKD